MRDVTTDGVERLRRWSQEQRGVPPAVGRLGALVRTVARGTTTVQLPLTGELLLPDGSTTAAVTARLADIGLTTSVVSSLPDLRGVTTISMSVDHHRAPPASGHLVSTCTADPYADAGPQHARGLLHDDRGALVASVSGWFLATPADQVAVDRVGPVREPLARHLLDLLQIGAGPHVELVARDALSNAIGSLHGGIGALAAQLVGETALEPGLATLTSSFVYLRPTPRDGAVRITGTVVRQGRRTGLASAVITDGDGRALVTATLVAGLR